MRIFLPIVGAALALSVLAGTVRAQEEELSLQPTSIPADVMMEMQDLYQQLQSVSERLSAIQEQAFEQEEIMTTLKAFEQQLKEKMVGVDPDSEKTLEELEGLIDELSAVEATEDMSEDQLTALQEKYEQYQELAYSLQAVEQEARMDEALIASQENLEKLVRDAMTAIDPAAETLIQQHESLVDRFMELEEKQMSEMGQDLFDMPQEVAPPIDDSETEDYDSPMPE